MTRLQRFLLRLYPTAWRIRYGAEMAELLSASKPGLRGNLDLFRGAIRLQMTGQTLAKMAVLWAVLGLVIGVGSSFCVTPIYRSTAVLRLDAESPSDDPLARFVRWKTDILSRGGLSLIAQSDRLNLYPEERRNHPLEDVLNGMRRDLTIQKLPSESTRSVTFEIAFTYRDKFKVRDTLQAVVTEFVNKSGSEFSDHSPNPDFRELFVALSRVEERVAALEAKAGLLLDRSPVYIDQTGRWPQRLVILDPPGLPEMPLYPGRPQFGATGAICGVVLALVLWLARRSRPIYGDRHAA